MMADYRSPVSRTTQYKKITKPLLERKRRARINRCLDELKDLMVGALEADGENISKLEKADILELTVRHLQQIHRNRDPAQDAQRFQAGFGRCAAEACSFLLSLPGVDSRVSGNLVRHLTTALNLPAHDVEKCLLSPPLSSSQSPTPIQPKPVETLQPAIAVRAGEAKGILRNAILERKRAAEHRRAAADNMSNARCRHNQDEDDREESMWRPW